MREMGAREFILSDLMVENTQPFGPFIKSIKGIMSYYQFNKMVVFRLSF